MKRILFFLFISLFLLPANAEKWQKKAKQAQVSVISYDAENNMKESQGFFVDEKGSVLTDYDIMKGSVKAVIVTTKGTEYPVERILGGNSMYNVAKLGIQLGEKDKCAYLTPAASTPQAQETVFILPSAKADKSVPCTKDTIIQDNTFNEKYHYYTLSNLQNERLNSCPVLNEKGELIGMVQPTSSGGKNSYIIDALYGIEMKIGAKDAGNNDLKAIGIRKALPDTEEEATSFIYLMGSRDTAQFMSYVEEFISLYPKSTIGYTMKAETLIDNGKYDEAEAAYRQALSIPEVKADEIHFSWAKTLYNLNLKPGYTQHADWNMEKALSETDAAYAANPLPIYLSQQGSCLYAMKRYDEAYTKYMELAKTNLRTADVFLYAAQCKQMTKADINEILALQDSAVACFAKPYPPSAANCLLIRGTTRVQAQKYREAVADYNEYEHLVSGRVTPNFYYEREQIEMKCRMFPNALNDIERAVRMAPREPVFRAEEAAVNYRVGQVDEAITAAEAAIKLDEKFPDAYRILGVCYNSKGDKEKARMNLQKAVELGDTMAQGILDKMK